jgi:VanZ family protein
VIPRRRNLLAVGLRWSAVLVWTGIIWWLVTLPGEKTPDVGFIPIGDKLGHLAVFFVWAFLICWAAENSLRLLSRTGIGVAAVLAATAYGIVSEIYQAQIGREAEVSDLIADTAGAIAAAFFYFWKGWRELLRKLTGRRETEMPAVPARIQPPPSIPYPEAETTAANEKKKQE